MSTAATSYRIDARVVRPGVSAATSKETVVEFDTSALQSEVLPGPADLLTTPAPGGPRSWPGELPATSPPRAGSWKRR